MMKRLIIILPVLVSLMISCGGRRAGIAKVETSAADSLSMDFDAFFVGQYVDPNDGSTLLINRSSDNQYTVEIGLFRLTDIDDGVGRLINDTLIFEATDAAGNPIRGNIVCDKDTAILTFSESTWEYLPDGTSFRFNTID